MKLVKLCNFVTNAVSNQNGVEGESVRSLILTALVEKRICSLLIERLQLGLRLNDMQKRSIGRNDGEREGHL